MNNKTILVIAAHPDDEVLGCGATIARLINEGHAVYTLILGEGITARDEKRDKEKRAKELRVLRQQAIKANKLLGVKDIFFFDYPDNRFDQMILLDIVKSIERIKNTVKPHTIFTHYSNDLNIDHQLTYQAVITATRPLPQETVREIYSFEILSSTQWRYPITFSPNVFFDVTDHIESKRDAMGVYTSELMSYPHPRSLDGIKINAQYWGVQIGVACAEAFKCIRIIR